MHEDPWTRDDKAEAVGPVDTLNAFAVRICSIPNGAMKSRDDKGQPDRTSRTGTAEPHTTIPNMYCIQYLLNTYFAGGTAVFSLSYFFLTLSCGAKL